LVMPVYLMAVFGLMSFALVLLSYGNAMFASKMGARYASVHSNTSLAPCSASSVQTLVTGMLMSPMATAVSVTTVWGSGGNTIGGNVTVSVKLTYGVLPWGIMSNVAATASTQAVIVH
jgi:Flp pilus assembly protein TadG